MKLTLLILLMACLRVSGGGISQDKVSLKVKDASLKDVLQDISRQTGYRYFFVDQWAAQAKKITLDVKNVSVEAALDLCFSDQPFTYRIVDKTIVVQQKAQQEKRGDAGPDGARPQEVRGVVRSESGEPLAGATVAIRKLGKSGITNEKGEFVLKNVPNGEYDVEISYVGYEKHSEEIAVGDNTIRIGAVLKRSKNILDEMQVIAYGSTSQRLNTGNVGMVRGEDIAKQPVNNPLLALEGRVPGLLVTQTSGFSGTGVRAVIQGLNSIANGSDPLFIVDGLPYNSQLLPNLGAVLGTSGANPQVGSNNGSPLSYINPMDIESITVLKGADATAIYGSRAANGAVLITTKKGKPGQPTIDINGQTGWGQVSRKLNVMNTPQYLQMRHEALANDGIAVPAETDYDINGFWDSTRHTDWQKKLIGGTAGYTTINATVSGGNENTQYLIGGTYHRESSVFPNDFTDQKISIHFNINNAWPNQRFRIQLSGNYLIDDNKLPNSDLTGTAMTTAPDAPPIYNPDGTLNWAPTATGTSSWYNVLAAFLNTYFNKTNNLISNAVLSYKLFSGCEIKANFGYNRMQSNEVIKQPLNSTPPESRPYTDRFAAYGNNASNTWIIEPQVTYKKVFGKHKLEALAGATIQQTSGSGLQLYGFGYNSDLVLGDVRAAAKVSVNSTLSSEYKYNAVFGRINYNWADKYIIDLTARRDGSSRFGSKNQFHNFGAVGAAWIFSQEKFIENNLSFISFGKIRSSYGTSGNDQIGDYQFLGLYSPLTGSVGTPYQGITALTSAGLPNPYLQWEETKKLEFGMDLGLFKDRILVSANFFQNNSSNQLLEYKLPITTGFPSVVRNFPAKVQNTGWEFSLHAVNIKAKNFTWISDINLTVPRNKLVSFPNLENSSYADFLVKGHPITLMKVYHYLGVDPATGLYQFSDGHNSSTSMPDTNNTATQNVLVNIMPEFYGGWQNTFQFKGVELQFLFQYVRQKGPNYFFGIIPGIFNANQPTALLDRWRKPGDRSSHQKVNSDFSLYNQWADVTNSDAWYADASYIRLKNISLSYTLASSWMKRAHLQRCRLYVQAQNLVTITSYVGLDPETRSSTSLPPLRVVTVGIQIGL